ncbi:uncharacterized protein BP5553_05576 [Venustampulla echinocandica]|uniref:DUF8021 domain-containing protein n=1 Tax=Venustampulla echinocandica TaxID=2656787 RepID=A0A370TRL8_9HELO|nr:uncharacterized protein BP5553_05576 [Venustampulla echinocandica]RDL38143.1 hypothetical protein BP5553_05576 [Venustampulla echinocandica]
MKIDHNRTILDTTACATYTELIITDSTKPYVIGTQIHHNSTADGILKVVLVDTIASGTGDWLFNATQTLQYVLQESWATIPQEKRDSRETLQAVGDAYLDLWGNPDAPVPWGTPCRRLEGSSYTGKGLPTDSCNVGIPGGTQPPNTDRRYVIDETVGSVDVLCTFGTMRDAPDSHELRLEGGKLRFVYTMTVMTAS